MKLWTCTMTDCQTGDQILAGIFSDSFKAEEQARVWVEGVTDHRAEVSDRDYDRTTGEETIYYRAKVGTKYEHYTAYIEIYTLDEMSY